MTVDTGIFDQQQFPGPVFSQTEAEKLEAVNVAWNNLCEATPRRVIDENHLRTLPAWIEFVAAAGSALNELNLRGKLPEDRL
jgi:hypothetical protein